MNKRLISTLVIVANLLSTTNSFADDSKLPDPPALVNEPDPGQVITPMKKGDKAPYTGVLLSPKSTASILVQLKSVDERIKIEIAKTKGEEKALCTKALDDHKVKSETDKKVAAATIDEKIKRIEFLEKKIADEEKSKPNITFWTSLGAVGGVVVTSLTFFVVSQAIR